MDEQRFDVVILGGGFAGLACAQRLEKRWKQHARDRVVLVSRENYFVFQPLLPEVVGGSVEPWHVINPIRRLLKHCNVIRAEINKIDIQSRRVELADSDRPEISFALQADQLVLALGSSTDMSKVPGMMEHGLFIKTLADALQLRGHVVRRLEEAVNERDVEQRRKLLHFVVVGGGYSGAETAAEILEVLRFARRVYRTLDPAEMRVSLVHSREYLLPELDEKLGRFAQQVLDRRGMQLYLRRRVVSVSRDYVRLDDDSTLATFNVVCTIGNAPHPLLRDLPCERDKGWIVTDEFSRVRGVEKVWGVGDCAHNPDGYGNVASPTAQFASRLGYQCGDNIANAAAGKPLVPFKFRTLGQVATLGYHNGVAVVMGYRLSGFVAWWITRSIHLLKLPGIERKTRVVIDWTLELFFPRSLEYLDLSTTEKIARIHVEPGDVIMREGARASAFYLIEEGVVELRRESEDGQPAYVEQLGGGEHFGEGSLLSGGGHQFTATAKTPATLLAISPRSFNAVIESFSLLRGLLVDSSLRFAPESQLDRVGWSEFTLNLPVVDLMGTPVVTLSENATIADAYESMAAHRHSTIPLVDDAGKLSAFVSKSDLYKLLAERKDLSGPVRDIASRSVISIRQEQTVREALTLFRRRRIKHAPVVDGAGRPVGMLSYLDLGLAQIRTRMVEQVRQGLEA